MGYTERVKIELKCHIKIEIPWTRNIIFWNQTTRQLAFDFTQFQSLSRPFDLSML